MEDKKDTNTITLSLIEEDLLLWELLRSLKKLNEELDSNTSQEET